MSRLLCASLALFTLAASAAHAAGPLSRRTEIDFFRDVPSRNLHGLATRSDGRLVAGPVLTDLAGPSPAELLWGLEPAADGKWLAGSGPDGRILELTLTPASSPAAAPGVTTRTWAKLDDTQVFVVRRLVDGTVLAGTSPKGSLALLDQKGTVVARAVLPVDSIFEVLASPDGQEALVATGNPGRIYAVDLARFARSGIVTDKITDARLLAERGIRLWGEIRDRNVRRLVRAGDRVIAGSVPRGNIYAFDATPSSAGGAPSTHAPVILQENRDAEVTDLLPDTDGGVYATIIFSPTSAGNVVRINPALKNPKADDNESDLPALAEKFSGRSTLVYLPADGFPETLTSRNNVGFYRLARQGDTLLVAGGEQGELLGYDLRQRVALTFAGSASAQLNDIAPLPGTPGRFLLLRNNAPGLALLDFTTAAPRTALTRRIDLGSPATLGALRFNRVRELAEDQLALEATASNGTDELEGWAPWTPLAFNDGGWRPTAPLRGRYVKLRFHVPPPAARAELDKPALYSLPQNRRPQLADFRVVTPNLALVPQPDSAPSTTITLGQLVNGSSGDKDRRRDSLLASQLVPAPGNQLIFWNVTDADNDEIACTFSLRRDGDDTWTDLAIDTHDSYVQFDTTHLPEGLYFTRLVAAEQAPRPAADRLRVTFETDDLLIDRTPPEILDASATRDGDVVKVSVRGRDALSLLEALELNFNNGVKEVVEQPVDGILDGRKETFVLELPVARAAGATSVEVILYDEAGNSSARRLPLKP